MFQSVGSTLNREAQAANARLTFNIGAEALGFRVDKLCVENPPSSRIEP